MNKIKKGYIFIVSLLGAFLGAWAGADGTAKAWRRIGISLLLTASALFFLSFNWTCIFIMSLAGILSLGYGVPDDGDEGSDIGRFWFRIFKEDTFLTNIGTRGTIGLLECIPLVTIPLIRGNWFVYACCSVGLVLNNILWGALVPGEGMITIFGKKLLIEEALIYLFVTALYLITILF